MSLTDSRLQWTGWMGLSAAAVYVVATAAGSLLDPQYSQVRQHVSDLTATGARTWALLVTPYIFYNLLVSAFAVGLYLASPRTWLWRIGFVLLMLNAASGIGMVTAFREDAGGVSTTPAGTVHVALAGISSLSIVIGSIAFALAFSRSAAWRPLARFSLAVAIGFAIVGPLAAIATAAQSQFAGLAERSAIGLFVAWLAVVGWFCLHVDRPAAAERSPANPSLWLLVLVGVLLAPLAMNAVVTMRVQ